MAQYYDITRGDASKAARKIIEKYDGKMQQKRLSLIKEANDYILHEVLSNVIPEELWNILFNCPTAQQYLNTANYVSDGPVNYNFSRSRTYRGFNDVPECRHVDKTGKDANLLNKINFTQKENLNEYCTFYYLITNFALNNILNPIPVDKQIYDRIVEYNTDINQLGYRLKYDLEEQIYNCKTRKKLEETIPEAVEFIE